MAGRSPKALNFFTCPNCNALYQLVRVEAGHEAFQRELTCRSCGAPFPARDGKFDFKYFMLRRAARAQRWKRPRLRGSVRSVPPLLR